MMSLDEQNRKPHSRTPHRMKNQSSGRCIVITSSLSECNESRTALRPRSCGFTIRAMNYQDIITIEPGKRGGKPCIRGMRITVYDVLEYLASGMSQQEVLAEFPYLTEADILACLAYAADREKHLLVAT